MDVEYERTLCQLPAAHVFRIPPARGAEGHRASDWPQKPTWTGRLTITAKGRLAVITLIDREGNVFAKAPVGPGTVERTVDSGRYFVLRIENEQGKHAFIGLAFNERNDAFDFNVALQEHENENNREDQAASGAQEQESFADLSLKQGEKIRINIGSGTKREKKAPASLLGGSSGGGGGLLAPPRARGGGLMAPPPARGATAASSSAPSTAAAPSAGGGLDFGPGFEGLSAVAPEASTAPSTNPFDTGAPAPNVFDQTFGALSPAAGGTGGMGFGLGGSTAPAPAAATDPFASAAVNPFGSPTSAPEASAGGFSDPFASVGPAVGTQGAGLGGILDL